MFSLIWCKYHCTNKQMFTLFLPQKERDKIDQFLEPSPGIPENPLCSRHTLLPQHHLIFS